MLLRRGKCAVQLLCAPHVRRENQESLPPTPASFSFASPRVYSASFVSHFVNHRTKDRDRWGYLGLHPSFLYWNKTTCKFCIFAEVCTKILQKCTDFRPEQSGKVRSSISNAFVIVSLVKRLLLNSKAVESEVDISETQLCLSLSWLRPKNFALETWMFLILKYRCLPLVVALRYYTYLRIGVGLSKCNRTPFI